MPVNFGRDRRQARGRRPLPLALNRQAHRVFKDTRQRGEPSSKRIIVCVVHANTQACRGTEVQ